MVARAAGVGKLLLGHYSARYHDETVLLKEAKEIFEESYLTNEGMVYLRNLYKIRRNLASKKVRFLVQGFVLIFV